MNKLLVFIAPWSPLFVPSLVIIISSIMVIYGVGKGISENLTLLF
jgi:ABC-type antimicrobial peptide transport system permease subunit